MKSLVLDRLFKIKVYSEMVFDNPKYANIQKHYDEFKISPLHIEDVIRIIKDSGKFELYCESIENIDEELLYQSQLHGISHNERVSVFAFAIGILEKLDDMDLKILLEAAKYHDIGREDDSEDDAHGLRSSRLITSKEENLSEEELKILQTICICHSIDDEKFAEVAEGMNIKDIQRCRKLFEILKDADALDRVRIRNNGLDISYLRTEHAKKMVLSAYELLQNYKELQEEIESEEVQDFPESMIFDKDLTQEQIKILQKQWTTFNRIQNYDIRNKGIIKDENGKLLLEEGTLIHGTGNFETEVLESISRTGILAGEFLGIAEDGETYYCADFIRVSERQTMSEYTRVKTNGAGGRIPTIEGSGAIAFIINPSEEFREIMQYDVYSEENDNNSAVRDFLNPNSGIVQRFLGEDKGKAAAIIGGIPTSCFSGLLVGDAVIQNLESLEKLKKIFPHCYITDRNGEILYEPTLNQNLENLKEERDFLKADNVRLKIEGAKTRATLKVQEDSLAKERQKNREMIDKMEELVKAGICPPEVLVSIYLETLKYQCVPSWLQEIMNDSRTPLEERKEEQKSLRNEARVLSEEEQRLGITVKREEI